MTTFSAEDMKRLFGELNEGLVEKNQTGELCIVGGAVMCLVFKSRPSTKDVDAAFAPTKVIRELVRQIAARNDIPSDWLNDGVKAFLSENGAFNKFLELSNLRVFCATAEYMLALKAISMRLGEEFQDEADVRYLLRYLEICSPGKAIEVISNFFPAERIPQKTHYALEEILTRKIALRE